MYTVKVGSVYTVHCANPFHESNGLSIWNHNFFKLNIPLNFVPNLLNISWACFREAAKKSSSLNGLAGSLRPYPTPLPPPSLMADGT